MEKNLLGGKIKELRTGKGYSQEYLAELSQISLRTVQRIENGETEARGDTLNRLAKALEIGIEELININSYVKENGTGYFALINVAGLTCLYTKIPFLGVVIPLILWQMKKEYLIGINDRFKKFLNFQITWALIFWLFCVLEIVIHIFHFRPNGFVNIRSLNLLVTLVSIPGLNALGILINIALILTTKKTRYWPAIKFFK